MRIVHWLLARARSSPHAEALITSDQRLSWAELAERTLDVARRLQGRGVEAGSRVAVLLPSGVELVSTFHATPLCGAIALPLNTRLTELELAELLRGARATHLVYSTDGLAERATKILEESSTITGVCLSRTRPSPGTTLIEDLELDSTLAVLFTSGTSGKPKGACLSVGNLLFSAIASLDHLGVQPGDRWLACLPLFHIGGLAILVRSTLAGHPVVVHERFDPERVHRDLAVERITLVSLVPTMLSRLLEVPRVTPRPPCLRAALIGGAAAKTELLRRAARAGIPALPTYGLTETASQIATAAIGGRACNLADGVVGPPLLGSRIRIVAADGAQLGSGETGEICVHGPTLMQGYLDDPGATREALRDGWFHTGDLGILDERGRLTVLDRRDDLIQSGGENVYPAEIEATLHRHPGVVEAGVAGTWDADLGQRVAAWVVPRPGSKLEPEALRAFCRGRLAGFKVPREIYLCESLPRSPAGKLLRRRLGRGQEARATGGGGDPLQEEAAPRARREKSRSAPRTSG